MELRQLRSFLKIVELQSFSKAAKDLGYSQSALSVQIHGLEQELGVRLFDRMGKQVGLTQPGKELCQRIVPVLHQLEEIRVVMQEKPPAETLHLGMIQSLCKCKMPKLIQFFGENYPHMNLTITLDSPSALLDKMDHNQVDFVYILDEKVYNVKWEKVLEEKRTLSLLGPLIHLWSTETKWPLKNSLVSLSSLQKKRTTTAVPWINSWRPRILKSSLFWKWGIRISSLIWCSAAWALRSCPATSWKIPIIGINSRLSTYRAFTCTCTVSFSIIRINGSPAA